MASKHTPSPRGQRPGPTPPVAQPVLEGRTDEDLVQNVRDLLAFSQEVNVANVDVRSFRGVVTLRGVVTSASERQAVETIARSVPGIVDVVNGIIVVPSRQG